MSHANVEIARQAYEAFGRGDIPALMEHYAPDVEWYTPAGSYRVGGVHRGHQAIISKVFMVLGELWEELAVTPREFVPAGDRVFVLGDYRAKGRATGKTVNSPFVHVVTFKDGKITRFEDYEDTATGNEAVRG